MTRFSAETGAERRTLFAEAIAAHRERESPFLTIEAQRSEGAPTEDGPAPWVQFATDAGLLNLDCTDEEIDAVESVVREFGGARIVERTAPEEADGINLQIAVEGDEERIATLIESLFRDGFGLAEDYWAWATRI